MHLLIDVGNSRIKWAVVADEYNDHVKTSYGSLQALETFISTIDTHHIQVLLAAVNQTDALAALLTDSHFESVKAVRSQIKQAGVENSYQQPERMGIDRWLGMIAAHHLASTENSSEDKISEGKIIVDAGSAMTIDVLKSSGLHLGGYIVPGLTMAQNALFSNTEQVNRYIEPSLPDVLSSKHIELGKNTVQCVEYGVISQLVALIKQVVEQYPNYKLIITGGDGELLARFFDNCIVDHNLVLKGLWQVRN